MKYAPQLNFIVGLFILLGLLSAGLVVVRVSGIEGLSTKNSYEVIAYFENIAGLKKNAPVQIAGVHVGDVKSITLNTDNYAYNAKVILSINEDVLLPDDTSVSILTSGLLGGKIIDLSAGGSDYYLTDGDVITDTQSGFILENLIGQFLRSMGS